ncbi:copper radical oxidase (WSC domain-containing protein) [Colletotrichum plurivorum]|uniref:Copper radical oxidase (WSC domain-containing protein) n=1 Tax=Colletotrichum plurivorum TaxID=2175906 RepID=A0A8H6KFZ4_9PEZI|nr:copper radical oxidase (WSC domain-containing protein) [Colletotrichum plurivorum]
MHTLSYLRIVGLTLASVASAADAIPGSVNGIAVQNIDTAQNNTQPAPKRSVELVSRGTSVRRGVVLKRFVDGICDALPSGWSYQGCFTDTPSNRVLSGTSWSPSGSGADGLTQEKCIQYCESKGYGMAGVEWGKECFCGYALDAAALKSPESECSKKCTGNDNEVCGEGGRINVFTNGDTGPTVLAASGGFNSIGCYSDHPSARTLTYRMSLTGKVKVSDCTSACASEGFPYAGLEFGEECFCGTSIQNGGAPTSDKKCNMACTADKTQFCGGAQAINIYLSSVPMGGPSIIPDGWTSKGCHTDSASTRALSFKVHDFEKFSAAQCVSKCAGLKYPWAGLEYGSECFCGNSIEGGNTPAASGCDMTCKGNRADTCGGAGRVNLYQAPCGGTPGCHFGYGWITTIWLRTTKQCLDACHANPDCKSVQIGQLYDNHDTFCNLFTYQIPLVIYPEEVDGCEVFTFYDGLCIEGRR